MWPISFIKVILYEQVLIQHLPRNRLHASSLTVIGTEIHKNVPTTGLINLKALLHHLLLHIVFSREPNKPALPFRSL